eukprot:scaffold118496_cov51-Phaeocystis_antarctica.AAC.1
MVYSAAAMQLGPPMELLIPAPSSPATTKCSAPAATAPVTHRHRATATALAALSPLSLPSPPPATARSVALGVGYCQRQQSVVNPWNLSKRCLDTAHECGRVRPPSACASPTHRPPRAQIIPRGARPSPPPPPLSVRSLTSLVHFFFSCERTPPK